MMAIDAEEKRRSFFRDRFPDFWATVEGFRYAELAAHPIAREDADALRACARDAWRIFARTMPVLQALSDDDLQTMGIPRAARSIVRTNDPCGPGVFARFDFALTDDGPKVLEINAETPFFLWETHAISGAVAEQLGMEDPNAGAEDLLRDGMRRTLESIPHAARLAVTAMNPYREDWFTAQYIARMLREASGRRVRVVPTSDLRIRGGALRDADGEAIDVLWRMYPLEHFANDRGGSAFCRLVEEGSLRIVNPPSALLLQNKAAQAIIWALHENHAWFDETEREVVDRVFLPSWMEAPERGRYVRKPVLGREGNSVEIVDAGDVISRSAHRTYASQPMLYQQYAELPAIVCGDTIGHGVFTVFVVAGEPTAVGLRVGAKITDAWARFVPLGIK